MIRKSFVMLDRVGLKQERNIWNQGIHDWDDFLKTDKIMGISNIRKKYYDRRILEARRELFADNSQYFTGILNKSEYWRLFDFFKEDAVYIDIETDGVNETDDITVVGIYDGIETKTMIRGLNLDFKALKRELARYKIIVSFNGSVFDVPFIRRRYGKILPEIPHYDLRFCCKRVGLIGGLKAIEKKLEIKRSILVEQMYGGDAALLHRMWRGSGDEHYLNLLVEYNEDDTINLKKIAGHVYGEMTKNIINSR